MSNYMIKFVTSAKPSAWNTIHIKGTMHQAKLAVARDLKTQTNFDFAAGDYVVLFKLDENKYNAIGERHANGWQMYQ